MFPVVLPAILDLKGWALEDKFDSLLLASHSKRTIRVYSCVYVTGGVPVTRFTVRGVDEFGGPVIKNERSFVFTLGLLQTPP